MMANLVIVGLTARTGIVISIGHSIGLPNVQAFIRRASSMADKTSWTKPLACVAYGDSSVETAGLEVGTVGGTVGRRGLRPPWECHEAARRGGRRHAGGGLGVQSDESTERG